ncbi:MAG: rhodanese-like domain-containing protein [Burkholderiales bacterium]
MDHTQVKKQFPITWVVFGALIAFWLWNVGNNIVDRSNVVDVEVAEAKSLIDSGAIIVDVRPRDRWAEGHIPGAISAPLSEIRNGIPKSLEAAKDKPIVVYCGDGEGSGPPATIALNRAGYDKAVHLNGGFGNWTSGGLPTTK